MGIFVICITLPDIKNAGYFFTPAASRAAILNKVLRVVRPVKMYDMVWVCIGIIICIAIACSAVRDGKADPMHMKTFRS